MEATKGVVYLSKPKPEFEQEYLQVRQAEGRVYADDIVKQLPEFSPAHPLANEWALRKKSAKMLVNFFNRKINGGNLLEVGSGNGWLCAFIAGHTNLQVSGLDVNQYELGQAARVFPSVDFFYGDFFEDIFPPQSLDFILFSSSLQYFPHAQKTIGRAKFFLKKNGSIIISDTPIYTQKNLTKGQQQTRQYYARLGFAAMASHYYHHLKEDIISTEAKTHYNPHSWQNRLIRRVAPFALPPFPIIEIKPDL